MRDIPDLLLFPDAEAKSRAVGRDSAEQRYVDGVAVGESKRFGLPLDARDGERLRASRTPHGQMLRYLSTAEIESDGRIRWGMLTSGDVWRLYYSRARPALYRLLRGGPWLGARRWRRRCAAHVLSAVQARVVRATGTEPERPSCSRLWTRAGGTRSGWLQTCRALCSRGCFRAW